MKEAKLYLTDRQTKANREFPMRFTALQAKFPEINCREEFIGKVAWELDQQTVNLHNELSWLIQDCEQVLSAIEGNGAMGISGLADVQNAFNVNVRIGKIAATAAVLNDMIKQREEAAKLTTAPSH